MNINLRTPRQLKEHLDEYIIGQDDAKKVIATAVYNHYKRIILSTNFNKAVDKSNIMLLGPTGCGKTAIVKCIAEYMDVPYYISDATTLTEAGYVGDDVESILGGLLRKCGFDVERAEYGIIFIDEIDKLAKRTAGSSLTRDVGGEGVQQALLKIIEGAVVGVPQNEGRKHPEEPLTYIDTSNILFIGSGAFSGILDILDKRFDCTRKISYSDIINNTGHKKTAMIEEYKANPYSFVVQEDLKKFGFLPEFIGRFPVITSIKKLTTSDFANIISKPKHSILSQYKDLFGFDDIKFTIEDDAIQYIAEVASKMETGARALRSIFEDILQEYMFTLPGSGKTSLRLTKKDVISNLSNKFTSV